MSALAGVAWSALRWLLGSEGGRLVLVAGVAVLLALGYGELRHQWGKDIGAATALEQAREDTRNAINDLAGEADAARLRRRMCVDSGGVYVLADNICAAR